MRALIFLVLAVVATAQTRRPMSYADTAQWRSISGQKLAPNGGWLGYGLFPQDEDGEVVLRNLNTDAELRSPAGLRPPPPAPDPEREGPPVQRTTQLTFTSDSSFAVFTTFAPKANAKAKPGLVVANLKGATQVAIAAVKSYQLAVDGANYVAYLKDDDAKTLVLRALDSGAERTVTGVTEYALAKDGQTLVYATDKAVMAWNTANAAGQPATLTDAEAKYARLTWDEKNAQLAFTSPTELYLWDRRPGKARALNVRLGYPLSANGTLNFSRDGARLYFPTAPLANESKPDGVKFDLWHWQDEQIQPMQKIRASAERKRSYRAVFHVASKRAVQLATVEMPEVIPAESGLWAIGVDDRPYRAATDYEDGRLADQYLVNLQSGERKLLGEKRASSYTWSPDGRYAIRFEAEHWQVLQAATGAEINVTRNLKVAFHNEDYDSPGRPGPYAPAQWTRDGKSVLLADRYDIWQLNPDGSNARNLTAGTGRERKIQFRIVRTDAEERQEGVDPARPLLLRAESLETRDTGFFAQALDGGGGPRQLAWANRNYATPVKAKGADVLMLTASAYRDYPDILITNSQMQSFRKVTEANPQLAEYRWGTAELMPFRSADGTALQAAVYKPEGFDPQKKYPVIVYLYERLSQNVHNFPEPRPTNSINIGIYVSNGYIVLTPDIVYREGYPGDSALSCVMPAVQKLIEQGFVDEKRIGIQGHSWGGYQIAYMLTRTNLFRAASAGAAVVNMISAYNGVRWGPGRPRQFQYERTQSRIGGTPWQYPLRFIDNSPVFRADQIQTPIMTIHNDADDAVPWYQGIEFYLSLRRLGKEIYLFNYNGEPHNLRQRPNQLHYSERMLEYFNHFLQDAPKPAWMVRGRTYLEREPAPPAKASDQP